MTLLTDYTRFVSCGCQVDCIAICFSRASSMLWMVELSFQLHFALVDAKWNVSNDNTRFGLTPSSAGKAATALQFVDAMWIV